MAEMYPACQGQAGMTAGRGKRLTGQKIRTG